MKADPLARLCSHAFLDLISLMLSIFHPLVECVGRVVSVAVVQMGQRKRHSGIHAVRGAVRGQTTSSCRLATSTRTAKRQRLQEPKPPYDNPQLRRPLRRKRRHRLLFIAKKKRSRHTCPHYRHCTKSPRRKVISPCLPSLAIVFLLVAE
jgi:hypothetical protein